MNGQFFIVNHGKPNYPGYWGCGAGSSVLKGERPLEGARRELLKETGIPEKNGLKDLYRIVTATTTYRGYLCVTGIPKQNVTLQKGGSIAFRQVTQQEFRKIFYSEQFVDMLRERLADFVEKALPNHT